MVTYEQLWAADPTAWRAAGTAWGAVVGVIERRAAEVSRTAEALRSGWSGMAGRAADGRLGHLHAKLAATRPAFIEIDQLLAEHGARLAQAKAMLDNAVSVAARTGVLVDRDGRVCVDPASASSGPTEAAADQVAVRIRKALDLATTTDRDTTRRLGDLAAAVSSGWVSEPPGRPPSGADPVAVRQWWDALTTAQRRWLVGHELALVGRLDGVPAAARDQANRLLLDDQRAALLARLAGGRPQTPGTASEIARIGRTLAGLDALAGRLGTDAGPRAYLLGLDSAGDGRAIVAFGNPDQADNVLTYVPGTTSDLPGIDGELSRAHRLATRCAELGAMKQTAAVLWLDYDAPDHLDDAMHASYAHHAGPTLHRFQEGLRATHDGSPAHQTVFGHSYGSVVVGVAARDHGLAADSLVFLGSPGVGVNHAADLHVPAQQVWSSTARDDIIQYGARAPGELLRVLAAGVTRPVIGAPLALARPGDELWFGHNPSDPGFGGQVFASAARGHSGYWDAGNPALDGMARIALGERP